MAGLSQRLRRFLPRTLFGRLSLLLLIVAVISQLLAFVLMFVIFARAPKPPPGFDQPGIPHIFPPGPPPFFHFGLMLDLAVRLAALLLAAWVGARWLSEPIRRLAGAASALGSNIHRAPLEEEGTMEYRGATRVFNQMQSRIRQQLEQRDQFVAAVSHDLRTPLTRLALRAEGLQDAQDRERFGKDIVEMDAMIRATLDYLCGAAEAEPLVLLDVGTLVSSMVHDCQDVGQDVQLTGAVDVAPLEAQTSALRRCIGNLIENAVHYGARARVGVAETVDGLQITVQDDGPGIPADELDKVLVPFYRVESSRGRNSGGVGLGLATASDIAQRHGGHLSLANVEGGGLRATITLPRKAPLP